MKAPVVFICCILASGLAHGQAVSQISGTVTDSSGAAVVGVQIIATQTDTDTKRTATTDDAGTYVLPNLPIGPYRLDAAKAGFRSYLQTGIVLQVNSAPVIPITLPVGEFSTQIKVEANATQVETTNMGVANVVDQQKVLDLPLNGRQPTDLIVLSGAAVQTNTSPQWGMQTGVQISIAGGLDNGVGYALDGAALSNFYDGTGFPMPFPDALQEFKVETSSLTAMNGTHSAGSVNAVTRSGSNAFHGDLFEFIRNGDLNARNFFAPQKDDLKRNQFGGVIGGPIKKDKLFFFAGYQGTTIRTDQDNNLAFVPTAAMLQGNFSACNNGPVIPNFQLNPSAAAIVTKLPQGTGPCGEIRYGIPNVVNNVTLPTTSGQIVGRIDYQQSPSNTIFGRYIATWDHAPVPYDSSGENLLTTNNNALNDLAQSAALGDTWLINLRTFNSLHLAMNREAVNRPGPSFFGPSELGINAYASAPNSIWVDVPGSFSIGTGVAAPLYLYNTTVQLNDDVSLVRGRHQFAFGADVAQALVDGLSHVLSQGVYVFAGTYTGLPLADFLTGQVGELQQATPNGLIEYQKFFGLYAQDTWKLTRRLTLNYGLRWEPFIPSQMKTGQVYSFSMAAYELGIESRIYRNAPAGFSYPGDPGFNGNASTTTKWKDFQPRVGFAWDPFGDGRTAIRGGAGIAYDFWNLQLHHNDDTAAPFGGRVELEGVNFSNPWENYPGGDPFPYTFSRGHALFPAFAAYMPIPANLQPPQVQQWNLGIQRQFTNQWFATATYMGNHGLHELNLIELNPASLVGGVCDPATTPPPVYNGETPDPSCSSPDNVNPRRMLNLQNPVKAQDIGYLTAYDSSATSDYNGLLLSTTYRLRSNLNFNANYTWSHCVGDIGVGGTLPQPGSNTPHNYVGGNRRLDRGNCAWDIRQTFNLTAVAQSPHFSGSSLLDRLASDWRLSVIDQYRTGPALNLNTGIDNELDGQSAFSFEEPNRVLPNRYGNSRLQYLNPAAFATPALGTFGNAGVFSLAGPSFWELDTALSRIFRILEHQSLEARWEAFNITNSMRPLVITPGNPNDPFTTLDSGTFGQVTQSYDPRILQFAVKYVF